MTHAPPQAGHRGALRFAQQSGAGAVRSHSRHLPTRDFQRRPSASPWRRPHASPTDQRAALRRFVTVSRMALLLWLASYVADQLGLPFHITGFLAAVEGALIVGVVSWLLHLVLRDRRHH
jgi:hypothetical protein